MVKGRLHSTGDASPLAGLLLPQILPVFSVVAPCRRGASSSRCDAGLSQGLLRGSKPTRSKKDGAYNPFADSHQFGLACSVCAQEREVYGVRPAADAFRQRDTKALRWWRVVCQCPHRAPGLAALGAHENGPFRRL